MEREWVVILVLGLLAAYFVRAGPLDQPHTLEYDSELTLKLAREILQYGHIPEKEPLRYAGYFPGGWDNRELLPLVPYIVAGLSFGQESLVKQAAIWYPLICAMLLLVVMSYIGKELFGYPGLIAGVILGVLPGFIFRTAAGSSDKDAGAMLLMLLAVYFYIKALKKNDWRLSLLSGISFGISSLAQGGYFLFLVPISLYTLIQTFRGKAGENLVYLPLISSLLIPVLHGGLVILNSYPNFVVLGTAAYVFIEQYFGEKLGKTGPARAIATGLKGFLQGLGKPFNRIEAPSSSIVSALIVIAIGMVGLAAIGRDPATLLSSLPAYLHNPLRGGIQASSVAEQTAVSEGYWNSELGIMKLVVYPFLGFINPTQDYPDLAIDMAFMILASIPLVAVVLLFEDRWEYLFTAVWAFFANFVAISAVRLFFPLMPVVALAGAGLFSYLLSKKTETDKDIVLSFLMLFFVLVEVFSNSAADTPFGSPLLVALAGAAFITYAITRDDALMNYGGYLVLIGAFLYFFLALKLEVMLLVVSVAAVAGLAFSFMKDQPFLHKATYALILFVFFALLVPSLQATKSLVTSIDPYWYQSLVWYKHNSQPLSPLATWWDYGYWIYDLADRPSLADGSNSYASADVDLGKMFTATNETDAISYLKAHDTKFVTMDGSMVPKFYWVSSIGFNNVTKAITYPQFDLKGTTNTTIGMARIYQSGDGNEVVVLQQGVLLGNPDRGFVAPSMIATDQGYFANPINATKSPGAILISNNMALYIQPEALDILFTKMYLLGGTGLERFTPVFNNGYIRTYETIDP